MSRPRNAYRVHAPHDGSASESLPVVDMEITRGRARQKVRRVSGRAYLIGSAKDCDLVLADAQFPDVYAYLLVSASAVKLCLIGSEPELTINGQPVSLSRELADGDRLRTGPFEFRVSVQWPVRRGGDDGDSTGSSHYSFLAGASFAGTSIGVGAPLAEAAFWTSGDDAGSTVVPQRIDAQAMPLHVLGVADVFRHRSPKNPATIVNSVTKKWGAA